MRWRFWKTWSHHLSLQLATFVVLIASFVVVTGVLVVQHNLSRILTLWGESIQMSVYLNDNSTKENISAVEGFLKNKTEVEKVHFIDRENALREFHEQMASYAPDLLADKDLLRVIPTSFQVTLSRSISPAQILPTLQQLAHDLNGQTGVDEVSYGQDWVKNYSNLTQALGWAGDFFALVILAAALFVMANAIHSSLRQRRQEIEILELIGATAWYIRLPFVLEGAFVGGMSSLLALGGAYGLFVMAQDYFHGQLSLLQLANHIQFLPVKVCGAIAAGGLGMGALSAFLCLRRLNDGWAASRNAEFR